MASDVPKARLVFREAPNTAAFVCKHVWNEGAPILYVSHDCDGDWQFLCGGIHSDSHDALLICLGDVVARDPSVNDVAGICTSHVAERDRETSPWSIRDETLENVRRIVAEHGWWVGLIDAEGEQPALAYTIGLHETFKHPEIIVFGLPLPTMHALLNECGALIRDGARFSDGASSADVLEGYDVRFRTVGARESHQTFLGYGLRFYGKRRFEVLQCVWPDKAHKFPGEDGAEAFLLAAQPMLP